MFRASGKAYVMGSSGGSRSSVLEGRGRWATRREDLPLDTQAVLATVLGEPC